MRRAVAGCVMLAALITSPRVAAAQELSRLAAGTRLRVNARCDGCLPRTGDLFRYEADTLWLGRGDPIASRDIISLEMLRKKDRGTGAGRGILVGLLVGAGFGIVLGAAAGGPTDSPGGRGSSESGAFLAAVLLAPLGAVAGGIIGASRGGEEWVPLPLPPVRASR